MVRPPSWLVQPPYGPKGGFGICWNVSAVLPSGVEFPDDLVEVDADAVHFPSGILEFPINVA
jgi:hypothetical protein